MELKNNLIAWLVVVLLLANCSEESNGPIGNDSIAPKPVTNTKVTNISGGAFIFYDIPTDDDLLYIEAKYNTKNGNEYKVRSSIYTDTLKIDGFGDTDNYIVNLFSVDRSENRSEPVTVQVTPLTPPIAKIYNSFTIKETFGGAKLQWDNKTKEQIVITVFSTDSISGVEGPLKEVETIYSAASTGDVSIRGYDQQEYRFAIQIRDRWDNVSEILEVTLTPLFEEALDKSLFKEIILPGDTKQVEPWNSNGASRIPKLWDGEYDSGDTRIVGFNGDMPDNYYYTFDLGVEVKLSRMRFWQFTQENQKYLYFDAQYEKFEIWGAKELDPSGNWDNWIKLRDCEVVKPSGLPKGQLNYTDEDREEALKGHDYDFPFDAPSVRYIRIKVNSTFSGLNWCAAGEMSLWGDY